MPKTALRLFLTIAILLGLFLQTDQASALPGTTWATGIKLQNLDATSEAILMIDLYSKTGSLTTNINQTASGQTLTAAANKSVEVYLPSYSFTSGTYSAVVSSNVKVAAVVTATNYAYGIADSYNTMEPATSVSVPYVYHKHNNWSTEIFIQNTSTTDTANVTVNLVEPESSVSASDGVKNVNVPLTIPPNGSISIDTSKPEFGTGGANDLGWFIGSATIQSSGAVPLAVAFSQIRLVGNGDVRGNVMISGRGLTPIDGDSKVLIPSLYKEFSGSSGTWRSGIKIQNLSTSSQATVSVTFASDPGAPSFSENNIKTVIIPASGNAELYLANLKMDDNTTTIPIMWRGSAVIEVQEPGVKVVANVQHTNYDAAGGFGVAIGYAGFASAGSEDVSLPSLYNWPSGAGVWVSGIKIQNVSSSPIVVDVEFTADPDSINKTSGKATNITLEGNSAKELFFGNKFLDGNLEIPSGWKGSASIKVVSGTGSVVATVVNTNYGRHVANMYTGVPIP